MNRAFGMKIDRKLSHLQRNRQVKQIGQDIDQEGREVSLIHLPPDAVSPYLLLKTTIKQHTSFSNSRLQPSRSTSHPYCIITIKQHPQWLYLAILTCLPSSLSSAEEFLS
ncbi:hypothetical protein CDAR_546601 [Caerostris darwini]|uniref:Uncharacterized protein n=1 Tax=Caerostris darwini TaxID=1538125 RepID=A0AAV4PCT3_9ARAC|nr:hypothetical protein CDAR_546601 [Caerostris darwini]